METVLKAIADWIKGILTAGITAGILHHTTLSIDSLKSLSYHNARRLDAVQAERIGFVLRLLF